MKFFLLLLSLLSPPILLAQDPPAPIPTPPVPVIVEPYVELPIELKVDVSDFIIIPAKTNGKIVKWTVEGSGYTAFPTILIDKEIRATTWAAIAKAPGVIKLKAYTALGDVPSDTATCTITIGNPTPVPPGPGPLPPDPNPLPPDPFLGSQYDANAPPGFKVLIVYDQEGITKYPYKQVTAMSDPEVRDYLAANCMKGPDGKTPEWRIWDKDVQTTNESALWKKAMSRQRASLPWIMIGTGTTGYEGPLPVDSASVLTLLRKYGG